MCERAKNWAEHGVVEARREPWYAGPSMSADARCRNNVMAERIRILIADDHSFYREGVRAMLEAMPEAEVVGEATTGSEAVAQADTLQPDVGAYGHQNARHERD